MNCDAAVLPPPERNDRAPGVVQQFLLAPLAVEGHRPAAATAKVKAAGGYGPAGSMVTVQLVWREMQVAMDWP